MKKTLIFPEAVLGVSLFGLAGAILDLGVLWRTNDGILPGLALNLAVVGLGGLLAVPLALRFLGLACFIGEEKAGPRKVAVDALEPEPLSLPKPGEDLPMRPVPKDRPEAAYKDVAAPTTRETLLYRTGLGLLVAGVMGLFVEAFRWLLVVGSAGVLCLLVGLGMFTVRLNRRH